MYTPPPVLVVGEHPLLDSRTQRRIRRALLAALSAPLQETHWLAEAPVLHYALPLTPRTRDDVVEVEAVTPCLCAWDRFLFPDPPGAGPHRQAPTWVCEVDEEDDATRAKLALHARAGVRRAWVVNPVTRSLSALALGAGSQFQEMPVERARGEWRLPPFESVPIVTSGLWKT
jgi:hypothetical protein